jgi:hypothetical protein
MNVTQDLLRGDYVVWLGPSQRVGNQLMQWPSESL